MVSLVQKKKDALKAKIYALHIEAHTKNLNTFRSDMAIHKKIDKGSVATLQKILIYGKKIVEDNKPCNWSNIQKVHKQIDIKPIQTNNIMISTSEIKNTRGNMFKRNLEINAIKNTRGNMFKRNLEINAIKNTQGNIFKREMMTIDVRIYRPAGDRKKNVT